MTVIPVLNVDEADETEAARRLAVVQGHVQRVHVDVADGTFAPTRTFRDPAKIRERAGGLKLQAHLMVAEPERIIEDWIDAGADEIVVHLEPLVDPESGGEPPAIRLAQMRETCLRHGAKLLIAGGPHLNDRVLLAHRAYADGFLVLAVEPGPRGQKMQEGALDTVRVIRDTFEDDAIWVDGGVNADTVGDVRAAGATGAVCGSIFDTEDPVATLAALQGV